jgi:gamma-glutamylcyclotransferase (GGCT)/AIG2-like uncharacterized protein YtfP
MHLFAYGSLEVPTVMQAVTGRSFRNTRARILGFERYMLKGRVYPGIIHAASGETDGRIYFDLDENAFARLDHFEADEYDRVCVEVEVEADGGVQQKGETRIEAFVYVIPSDRRDLLGDDRWDEQEFVTERLAAYLADTRRWMAGFLDAKK